MIGMPYNPPYYGELVEAFGLAKAKDLYAWEVLGSQAIPGQDPARRGDRAQSARNVVIRLVNLRDYAERDPESHERLQRLLEPKLGLRPAHGGRVRSRVPKQLRPLLAHFPEGALLAEVDGRPIGFCLAVVDANQALARVRDGRLFPFGFWNLTGVCKRVDQVRVMALGVRPEFRHQRHRCPHVSRALEPGQRLGYRRAEIGWTLEDNRAMNRAIRMGGRHHKTYRLYDAPLA